MQQIRQIPELSSDDFEKKNALLLQFIHAFKIVKI